MVAKGKVQQNPKEELRVWASERTPAVIIWLEFWLYPSFPSQETQIHSPFKAPKQKNPLISASHSYKFDMLALLADTYHI